MSESILNLEPNRLWYYFNELCKIPHCSYNEEGVRNYIIDFAKEKGFEYKKDDAGNLVVRKPGQNGKEGSKAVVIQGHLDMVCESTPDSTHDFEKDPIEAYVDGGWVTAKGTTLGSDNGIGVAAALAVMESEDIAHGPLECLFTVEEEIGLGGAEKLESGFVQGRTMVNLDTEVDGTIYVGCAGGRFFNLEIPYNRENMPSGYEGLELKVTGLQGGHSGLIIHENRGNALKLAARLTATACGNSEYYLSEFKSGTKHNVIPSNAICKFAVKSDQKEEIISRLKEESKVITEELADIDPNYKMTIESTNLDNVIAKDKSKTIIDFANGAPHGVMAMSKDIEGLVETSFNMAIVDTKEDNCYLEASTRSSVDSVMDGVRESFFSLARLAGVEAKEFGGYPGWKPNLNSKILDTTKTIYRKVYGSPPAVTAIHAGLECGTIGEKFPGMDMVAFGPQIEGAHSTEEKVDVESAKKFWECLVGILEAEA